MPIRWNARFPIWSRAWTGRAAALALGALAVVGLLLVASLVHRIFDSTRGTPLAMLRGATQDEAVRSVADPGFAELAAALVGVTFVHGNDVQLLVSADSSYARLFADLRAARRSITLQSYYCLPGRVADTTAAILAERARAGVRVLMLADGYGCGRFPRRYGAALREAGVELVELRPIHWYTLHKAQHRSHVRLAVIDGTIGYTGGFGIDDKWLYGTGSSAAWRDTNVRFEGPAARQAQAAFAVAWAEATRELIASDEFFERTAGHVPDAGTRAGVQFAGPGIGTSPFERLLFLTIGGARERLYVANAYFLPNRAQRLLLSQAARRGVDVRVLTAGDRSDVPSTRFAARAYYGELLDAGVRIFEYTPAMMHAKTIIADGILGVIGSMNFDNRSLRLGDELNLVTYDPVLGRALERSFEEDLTHAVEVSREAHMARSLRQRLLEQAARLIEPIM
jgi:cardiolipin synthase A/B